MNTHNTKIGATRVTLVLITTLLVLNLDSVVAETFGAGENQFTIDFVTITANPGVARSTNTSGHPISTATAGAVTTVWGTSDYIDPGNDYRMGVYEITNDQWDKFVESLGVKVTGTPLDAYGEQSVYKGDNVPTGKVSWYEAAQFVNWLNTSKGYQAAYKFVGTQGQNDYAMEKWSSNQADNGNNFYRHKDAMYYLPTEDEWMKAAYWNGTDIQTWATPDDRVPVYGVDSIYELTLTPWDVGSGSEELNGTFDMMGNLWEWMESPTALQNYNVDDWRGKRGGAVRYDWEFLASAFSRLGNRPAAEGTLGGFRVASEIPEPATLSLLALGGLALLRGRRRCGA